MARYVDVEKAEYPYMSMSMWGVNSKDCKAYNEGVKATEDMIHALPTADVVEVVRCKDCKRFMEYNEDFVGEVEKADGDCYIRKMYSCGDIPFCAVKSDDFCSYGERRTDNDL